MFVKICIERKPSLKQDIWLNTDQIVSLRPKGKSFHVCLSDGDMIALDLKEYLVLVKAMKIKEPLKAVKRKLFGKKKVTPSPAVFDKAKPKRAVDKQAVAKKVTQETGEGTAGEVPKTKLIKKKLYNRVLTGEHVEEPMPGKKKES